jgi:hypothetical protein
MIDLDDPEAMVLIDKFYGGDREMFLAKTVRSLYAERRQSAEEARKEKARENIRLKHLKKLFGIIKKLKERDWLDDGSRLLIEQAYSTIPLIMERKDD